MKVVYICAPFTAPNTWEIEQNVRRAENLALDVAQLGLSPLCPHTNTRYFYGLLPPEFWYEATMELMRRCDAVLVYCAPCYSHLDSVGCVAEIKEATRLGIPVFYSIYALREWLESAQQPVDLRYKEK
jgi:nucleoside 2-deoxyribosyltransferase